MKLISIVFLFVAIGASSAFAQSYGSLGNDPVRSHTYLGDEAIDLHGGGTLCYREIDGVVCEPVSHYRRYDLPKRHHHHFRFGR